MTKLSFIDNLVVVFAIRIILKHISNKDLDVHKNEIIEQLIAECYIVGLGDKMTKKKKVKTRMCPYPNC
jgi:hypothetical protein